MRTKESSGGQRNSVPQDHQPGRSKSRSQEEARPDLGRDDDRLVPI